LLCGLREAHDSSAVNATRADEEIMSESATKPLILVVDDEPAVRQLLAHGLPLYGFDVQVAADGLVALKLFLEQPKRFSLVLLDVFMPALDGPALLAALLETDPTIPCCFMTAFAGNHSPEQLLAMGAAGVVEKPFRLDALAATLKSLLA
jgi:CheY-like chemotaxis protein